MNQITFDSILGVALRLFGEAQSWHLKGRVFGRGSHIVFILVEITIFIPCINWYSTCDSSNYEPYIMFVILVMLKNQEFLSL